jgi:hypothetical protein
MRRTAALAAAVGLVLCAGGCTKEPPAMPSACTDTSRDGYERALAAAPGAVRLPGGVAISSCTRRVRSDAELQNLGTVVHGVAESLAERAATRADADAALRLGYLVGAVGAGAERSSGIASELARRVESATSRVVDGPAEVAAALRRGGAAGRARG